MATKILKYNFTAIEVETYFKKEYLYKMGGTQTIALPNGQSFDFDDREYYSGRGAKYNSSIRHDRKGIISIPVEHYNETVRYKKEQKKEFKARQAEKRAEQREAKEAKKQGLYALKEKHGMTFVLLSEEESRSRTFDAERLARTLNISVEDALLLNSRGKTYVYAKTTDGKTLMLYHASLDWNELSITVDQVDNQPENWEEWHSAPYAARLGQSDSRNHFVC